MPDTLAFWAGKTALGVPLLATAHVPGMAYRAADEVTAVEPERTGVIATAMTDVLVDPHATARLRQVPLA